ncbi:hypothetical protein WJX74_007131 [Apatococcus lobatus]|uniref:Uncharacterized protein n=2 Tax=Apatococcus TaxID=904362 RepID=A0AAW1T749_9CHLO
MIDFPATTTSIAGGQFRTYANDDALEASDAVVPLDPVDPRVREITVPKGIAFPGDLRSSSGLGLGDGLTSHTSKWQQGNYKSPMQWSHEQEPIKVRGNVVASYGSEDPALGAPVEYIQLKGTTYDAPAVCKYTGNKYYSEDWMHHTGGH